MKQKIISGLKKKLLLVELPEDYVVVSVFQPKRTLTMWNETGQYLTEKLDFDVEEIGKLTDITESQFAEWVDKLKDPDHFQNYNWQGTIADIWLDTAKESFFSKLESDEISFEPKNNLEKPNKSEYDFRYGHNEADLYNKHLKSWEEAQEKVWDKGRTWLFEIM